jgi:formylglycine-generating enzyme required for sulfatase activity
LLAEAIQNAPSGNFRPLAFAGTRRPACESANMLELDDLVSIPAGRYVVGSDRHYPEEAPVREVEIASFSIERFPVTNERFARFVEATGYVTVAERPFDVASLVPNSPVPTLPPGSVVFIPQDGPVPLGDSSLWWRYVPGANWRRPLGPRSGIAGFEQHPVVHVAYEDAEAYARWIGRELPSEDEWEVAARGGLVGKQFTWGDELEPAGQIMAKTWQGDFPWRNTIRDGFERTAPVGSFPPNGYGLYDMAGNVWEWTRDFYRGDLTRKPASCCSAPDLGDPAPVPQKTLKGGSHLCAPNYCMRFRPAARMPQPIDTGTSHVGFRCVARG